MPKQPGTDESREPSDGSAFASAAARDPGWCRVLESYRFRLDIPQDMLGRAMSSTYNACRAFWTPTEMDGQYAVLAGVCPVSEMRDYAMDVNVYTHGTGHLGCVFDGYRPCHNAAEVIEQAGYDPGDDLENTPDSVFCAHGAGYTVKCTRVPDFHAYWIAHTTSGSERIAGQRGPATVTVIFVTLNTPFT